MSWNGITHHEPQIGWCFFSFFFFLFLIVHTRAVCGDCLQPKGSKYSETHHIFLNFRQLAWQHPPQSPAIVVVDNMQYFVVHTWSVGSGCVFIYRDVLKSNNNNNDIYKQQHTSRRGRGMPVSFLLCETKRSFFSKMEKNVLMEYFLPMFFLCLFLNLSKSGFVTLTYFHTCTDARADVSFPCVVELFSSSLHVTD